MRRGNYPILRENLVGKGVGRLVLPPPLPRSPLLLTMIEKCLRSTTIFGWFLLRSALRSGLMCCGLFANLGLGYLLFPIFACCLLRFPFFPFSFRILFSFGCPSFLFLSIISILFLAFFPSLLTAFSVIYPSLFALYLYFICCFYFMDFYFLKNFVMIFSNFFYKTNFVLIFFSPRCIVASLVSCLFFAFSLFVCLFVCSFMDLYFIFYLSD